MRWKIPRWLARAPVPLLRRGFGWLLGPRFLLLEHIGRRTGLARYAVLEVVDRGRGEWYVVAAYGPRAQWYRNVLRQPRVR
ncbi:MAG: nitroreductase family deazaflavin-dependent oxidoreductase, partial [Pseudonocardiaceae bacterium]|nr:nitroreductase family deazaflavin-dependent oxidoreductase [Pseudonocardiaceae bacterium]